MKTISRLADLQPYGIHYLTGEADNLAYRALCDLTLQGVTIVSETFGLTPGCFPEQWNNDRGAIASCMLPHDAASQVGIVALLTSGDCHTVLATKDGHTLYGLEATDEYRPPQYDFDDPDCPMVAPAQIRVDGSEWQDWPSCYGQIGRTFGFGDHPRIGTRNVHQMTGRVV